MLDLTIKDFIVREDGQAREMLRVARDNDPLQIALLVDNSVSMRPRLSLLRKAVTAFIDATRDDVQLALITLAERPTIVVGYTTDRAALRKAADKHVRVRGSQLPARRHRGDVAGTRRSARCGARRSRSLPASDPK